MKYYLNVLVLVLFLLSCEREKELVFTPPFEGEKLIIYGVLENTGESTIEVYRSQSLTADFPAGQIDGVEANLINSSNDSVPYQFDGHNGKCSVPIDSEGEYYVSVKYGNQEVVSTKLQIPQSPKLDSVKFEYSADSTNILLNVFFTPKESNGFFAYTVDKIRLDTVIKKDLFSSSIVPYENFQGGFTFANREYRFDADSFNLKVYNVSKPIFDFYQAIEYNNDSDIGSQFSDKIPQKGNIIGGYGFFVTVAIDSAVIRFE